jgi:hypothetical protein
MVVEENNLSTVSETDRVALWLEPFDIRFEYNYAPLPEHLFLIGNTDPIDRAIRFAVQGYLSVQPILRYGVPNPPPLSNFSVFVCSPSRIQNVSDLGCFFAQRLRFHVQMASSPCRLGDSETKTAGYIVQLEFSDDEGLERSPSNIGAIAKSDVAIARGGP